jgi:signal transduction histidine kinase
LIITEVSETHPAIAMITQQIREDLRQNSKYDIEFFVESLDTTTFPSDVVQRDLEDASLRKYKGINLDVIVAIGPMPIRLLSSAAEPLFPKVPVVICAGILDVNGAPKLDSRFTGTWMTVDSAATLDLALRLFPNTKHVAVVAGSSAFDLANLAVTQAALQTYRSTIEVIELTGLEMPVLLNRLRQLPPHSIVLYSSFFTDATGKPFLNATTALPAVAQAANVPVFGMSDSYIGHGIIGGKVMSFSEQGHLAVGLIGDLLRGKKPEELPIRTAPNLYMFDWRELRRWHVNDRLLPPESRVLFRGRTIWEQSPGRITILVLSLCAMAILSLYLIRKQKQLEIAKNAQSELSGFLISAQEQERGRVARELHDDFSQRVALLTLGLETVAETIPKSPQEADRQIHDLLDATSELGEDLHTLSHRLHSSTLESLGLVSGVAALCKEFQARQGVQIALEHEEIPRSIDPDTDLCIFRIVQEALRNVKKHSGADRAEVKLAIDEKKIYVLVADHGMGFDPCSIQHKGLGVRSMEERARMLGGTFRVHTRPGCGTRVEAWVPINRDHPIQGDGLRLLNGRNGI